jgi:hypothetical protein
MQGRLRRGLPARLRPAGMVLQLSCPAAMQPPGGLNADYEATGVTLESQR